MQIISRQRQTRALKKGDRITPPATHYAQLAKNGEARAAAAAKAGAPEAGKLAREAKRLRAMADVLTKP